MSNKKIKNIGDLKEALEQYDDKMELKMFIPLVEDWADIVVTEQRLVRMKRKEKHKLMNLSGRYHNPDKHEDCPLNKVKMPEWELEDNVFVTESESYKKLHESKKIIMFSQRSRNKSTFDRAGDIHY